MKIKAMLPAAFALFAALIFALFLAMSVRGSQCKGGIVVTGGNDRLGGPFRALDHHGHEVSEKDVISDLSLLYFGYSFCPDICPLDLARNSEAVDLLAEGGNEITPVFVSVDPKRDTPELLSDFVEHTHPKMIGVTGSSEEIEHILASYRVYAKPADEGGEDYLVDHSSFSYLVSPKGTLAVYARSQSAEEIAESIACYAKAG